jgi:hypothetical protein
VALTGLATVVNAFLPAPGSSPRGGPAALTLSTPLSSLTGE